MIKLYEGGAYLVNGVDLIEEKDAQKVAALKTDKETAKKGTMAYNILRAHNKDNDMQNLRITFDAMTSHDITYVGIVQTAKSSGMENFPLPYVLTNCHNSLCAVGGTLNEDDHVFGLSCAKKYGGIFVPPNMAVMHQYMRETMAGGGKMILGSDSHTRYGALGTMAIGEGGGELVKQLLKETYDVAYPQIIGIYLTGRPNPGVGPHDIAIAIIGAVFKKGYVKNKVMEFVGPGVSSMTTDFRNSVDVMTTETACLTSIWRTDEDTRAFLMAHGRGEDYKELNPAKVAYYDGIVYVDLSTIKPMIALPFHPSNAYEIDEFNANMKDILHGVEEQAKKLANNPDVHFSLMDKIVDGKFRVQQGIIAGCAGGTYTNIMDAAHILRNAHCGNDVFSLSVYPSSQPIYMDLIKKGALSILAGVGAAIKPCFCGPCFGAGDTPANNELSVRHTTRNFPNREGSKPGQGQMAAAALMDARSIAATAASNGILTSATAYADDYTVPEYHYDDSAYKARVYQGAGKPQPQEKLVYGPNIKDWPAMEALGDNILLKVCSKIMDAVTTTDELIPSGETSTFRSNPMGLAQFALSRRDPAYVGKATNVLKTEQARQAGEDAAKVDVGLAEALKKINTIAGNEQVTVKDLEIGGVIYCVKPGDGSAREQAASCQRVLGGLANICKEYATKRYRSNVMNWGMIPFQMEAEPDFGVDDYIYVPNVKAALAGDMKNIKAYVIGKEIKEIKLYIANMTDTEKEIVKAGCLMNFSRSKKG